MLQQNLDNIYCWTTKWQLCLNPSKCGAFLISNKRKPLTFTYMINGLAISWNSIMKYLGVYIQSNLSWSHHCRAVSAKVKQSLNYLRHSLWGATTATKSVVYKVLVRSLLEYACKVWSPHTAHDISLLVAVQRRAARWACGSRWNPLTRRWNKSSDDCLDALCWPTLGSRQDYLSLSMLYDILNKRSSLVYYNYFHKNTNFTGAHELSIVPLQSSINCYQYSFFVNTAFLWNKVPFDILSMKSVVPFRVHSIVLFAHNYSNNCTCIVFFLFILTVANCRMSLYCVLSLIYCIVFFVMYFEGSTLVQAMPFGATLSF